MPVPTVASQSKTLFFAELCFVCAGWCFLLLFMHFFHSTAYFGSVFFRFKTIRQPSYAHSPRKILDKVIETGKGQKVKAK